MKNEGFNEANHVELTAGCKRRVTRRISGNMNLKNRFSANFAIFITNTKTSIVSCPCASITGGTTDDDATRFIHYFIDNL